MSYNKWTREEEQLLIQNVRYDHRGFVCNCNELAELLGIDKKRIWPKIHQMRKKDLIDEVYWDDPIEPPNKRYSQQEDKKIISMYQSGCPVTIIAQELNRTENAIRCRLNIMKKNGQLESNRKRRYTKRENDAQSTTRCTRQNLNCSKVWTNKLHCSFKRSDTIISSSIRKRRYFKHPT